MKDVYFLNEERLEVNIKTAMFMFKLNHQETPKMADKEGFSNLSHSLLVPYPNISIAPTLALYPAHTLGKFLLF